MGGFDPVEQEQLQVEVLWEPLDCYTSAYLLQGIPDTSLAHKILYPLLLEPPIRLTRNIVISRLFAS